MLYLAIDQHASQLTVNLRNERGDILERRQVSTRTQAAAKFFEALQQHSAAEGGFLAILEVCGFNDWLLAVLAHWGCREIVLVQPAGRSNKKTDRRDAATLGELLWVNRHRLLSGKPVNNLRRIQPPSARENADRQLTALRRRVTQQRTRTINKVHRILLKHNLQHARPTQGIQTKRARRWLGGLSLPVIDALEMRLLLDQWDLWNTQLDALDERIAQRCQQSRAAQRLIGIPGVAAYTALGLASRIGAIERFPRPGSLANYWGLTPACRNSGEAQGRLGSITKQGSVMARYLLGQLVTHVLRADAAMRAWYRRIKRRRGAKIARVAVMRRLTTIIWHMLRHNQPYVFGGPPPLRVTA